MSAVILDGKLLAGKIKQQLKEEVKKFKETTGDVPHLVNVMIGNDSSACAYANSQERVAETIGIKTGPVSGTGRVKIEVIRLA
jgi:methylenetetrahydrofolate dehydrogenase (NADP+)/methenyltetrahydrofolate cyclohydrolase